MTKEQVSSDYTETKKRQHAHKVPPNIRSAIVTGVSRNNIGTKIHDELLLNGFKTQGFDENDFDLTKTFDCQRMLNHSNCLDADTLVLCHGYTSLDWIEDQEFAKISKTINVNLLSHINLISSFAHLTMEDEYRKTIIVIGSMAAGAVLNGSAPYCAAKAGLQHFIKCVAWELAPKGFDVYLVNPSNVQDSPMTDKTIADLARYRNMTLVEASEYWSACNPRNEFLTKHEIATLVLDLAEGKHPYLSGTPLNLGGGQR